MWYSIKRDITNFNTLLYVNNTNGIQPIKVTVYKYDTTSLNNYRVFNTETEVINTATIELTPNAVFKIYSENTVTNSVSTQIIVNYETLLKVALDVYNTQALADQTKYIHGTTTIMCHVKSTNKEMYLYSYNVDTAMLKEIEGD